MIFHWSPKSKVKCETQLFMNSGANPIQTIEATAKTSTPIAQNVTNSGLGGGTGYSKARFLRCFGQGLRELYKPHVYAMRMPSNAMRQALCLEWGAISSSRIGLTISSLCSSPSHERGPTLCLCHVYPYAMLMLCYAMRQAVCLEWWWPFPSLSFAFLCL